MATQSQEYGSQAATIKQSVVHPLCPLTSSEISLCADLIRAQWPLNVDLRFKVVTLEEPSKKSLVPYLEAEHGGKTVPSIDRRAFVAYYLRNTVSETLQIRRRLLISQQDRFHEAIVNLSTHKVESNVRLGPNEHGNGDYEEILMVEKNALEDEGVRAEIAKLQLPKGTVVCADPWIYGIFLSHLRTNIAHFFQDLMVSTTTNAYFKCFYI